MTGGQQSKQREQSSTLNRRFPTAPASGHQELTRHRTTTAYHTREPKKGITLTMNCTVPTTCKIINRKFDRICTEIG